MVVLVDCDVNWFVKLLVLLDSSGKFDWIFGLGVMGMILLMIIILMLIFGFVICEVFGFFFMGWFF